MAERNERVYRHYKSVMEKRKGMKAKRETTVIIELTEAEAIELAAHMQNPAGPPEDEPKEVKEIREKIFNGIYHVLQLGGIDR